jgi:hypothetical protein
VEEGVGLCLARLSPNHAAVFLAVVAPEAAHISHHGLVEDLEGVRTAPDSSVEDLGEVHMYPEAF